MGIKSSGTSVLFAAPDTMLLAAYNKKASVLPSDVAWTAPALDLHKDSQPRAGLLYDFNSPWKAVSHNLTVLRISHLLFHKAL
jgi:hypothetical protein